MFSCVFYSSLLLRLLNFSQIWAYSRMAIGRPICRSMESIKFKYPLFKMWEQRLLKHKVLTTVEEVRHQLDGHGVDSVSCLLLYGFLCLLFT